MFDIRSITVDCADPYRQALFWSEATGWLEDPDRRNFAALTGARTLIVEW